MRRFNLVAIYSIKNDPLLFCSILRDSTNTFAILAKCSILSVLCLRGGGEKINLSPFGSIQSILLNTGFYIDRIEIERDSTSDVAQKINAILFSKYDILQAEPIQSNIDFDTALVLHSLFNTQLYVKGAESYMIQFDSLPPSVKQHIESNAGLFMEPFPTDLPQV